MMGLGDTLRGEKLPEPYSPASNGSGRGTEFERMSPKEQGSWQLEEDPVVYFRKQDPERRFKHAPLLRGHQKRAEVWWWA